MRIAILNGPKFNMAQKIENVFCGRYVPYQVGLDVDKIEDKKHVGIVLIDETNPELINKIINLIKNESR